MLPLHAGAHTASGESVRFGVFHFLLEVDHILAFITVAAAAFVIYKLVRLAVKKIIPLITRSKE